MTSKVNIYGEIDSWSDNSAGEFIKRFTQAEQEAEEIELHIHSCGGDVFEGNMIYNTIKSSKKKVTAYVDGIAASMASVIMMACEKIYMAENAFVMIHAPSSYLSGTAEEMEKAAKLLRSIEDNFVKTYAKRTGKKEEDVRQWMKGDNWFSAKEALEEGLIDGITDSVEIEGMEDEKDIRKSSARMITERFRAKANNRNIDINKKQETKMNKEKKAEMIAKWDLQGVNSESTDEEIYEAISRKMQQKDEQISKEKHSQIVSEVERAIKEKKITDKQKEMYEEIGEKMGKEKLSEIFEAMRIMEVKQSISSQIKSNNNMTIKDRTGWDWDKWQKEDAKGLERLAIEDKEEFDRLYNEKYINK